MMKTKKKILKPIDLDCHFKYRCENNSCGFDHWLSLKQVKTKNFKLVCDCGCVYTPKRIDKIKVLYHNRNTIKQNKQPKNISKIPIDLHDKVGKILSGYGFTDSECSMLANVGYSKNPTDDLGSLVKYIIQNLGELNDNN